MFRNTSQLDTYFTTRITYVAMYNVYILIYVYFLSLHVSQRFQRSNTFFIRNTNLYYYSLTAGYYFIRIMVM